ncbi:hypothetical protein [Pseudomonas sp. B22129]|uniref:hypothetical protein n=1 Tax=Pseudomonas sp. B22129 TaxID=3235111 RepID=UPI003782FDCC
MSTNTLQKKTENALNFQLVEEFPMFAVVIVSGTTGEIAMHTEAGVCCLKKFWPGPDSSWFDLRVAINAEGFLPAGVFNKESQ